MFSGWITLYTFVAAQTDTTGSLALPKSPDGSDSILTVAVPEQASDYTRIEGDALYDGCTASERWWIESTGTGG